MPIRYDIIDSELKPGHRTPEGYLMVDAIAMRPGVFSYMRADGSVQREARLPEDVSAPDALQSLAGKPVVLLHPREDGNPIDVTPENVADYQVGTVGTDLQVLANGHVKVQLIVHRQDALDFIAKGGRQLSPGYRVREDHTPGELGGSRYDMAGRDIRFNHLALVPRGRQGDSVAIRLDADSAIQTNTTQPVDPAPTHQRTPMFKIRIDGIEVEVADPAAAKLIEQAIEKRDAAEKALADANAKLAAETTRADEAEGKVAAFEASKRSDAEIEAERIAWSKERAEALAAADKLGVKLDEADAELSNAAIRRKVVCSRIDSFTDETPDAVISGAMTGLIGSAPATPASTSRLDAAHRPAAKGEPKNTPASGSSRADAGEEMTNSLLDAWKPSVD